MIGEGALPELRRGDLSARAGRDGGAGDRGGGRHRAGRGPPAGRRGRPGGRRRPGRYRRRAEALAEEDRRHRGHRRPHRPGPGARHGRRGRGGPRAGRAAGLQRRVHDDGAAARAQRCGLVAGAGHQPVRHVPPGAGGAAGDAHARPRPGGGDRLGMGCQRLAERHRVRRVQGRPHRADQDAGPRAGAGRHPGQRDRPRVTDTTQLRVDADDAGIDLATMHARYAAGIPLGRIGRPGEIASAVALLADPAVGAFVGPGPIQINGGSTRCRV